MLVPSITTHPCKRLCSYHGREFYSSVTILKSNPVIKLTAQQIVVINDKEAVVIGFIHNLQKQPLMHYFWLGTEVSEDMKFNSFIVNKIQSEPPELKFCDRLVMSAVMTQYWGAPKPFKKWQRVGRSATEAVADAETPADLDSTVHTQDLLESAQDAIPVPVTVDDASMITGSDLPSQSSKRRRKTSAATIPAKKATSKAVPDSKSALPAGGLRRSTRVRSESTSQPQPTPTNSSTVKKKSTRAPAKQKALEDSVLKPVTRTTRTRQSKSRASGSARTQEVIEIDAMTTPTKTSADSISSLIAATRPATSPSSASVPPSTSTSPIPLLATTPTSSSQTLATAVTTPTTSSPSANDIMASHQRSILDLQSQFNNISSMVQDMHAAIMQNGTGAIAGPTSRPHSQAALFSDSPAHLRLLSSNAITTPAQSAVTRSHIENSSGTELFSQLLGGINTSSQHVPRDGQVLHVHVVVPAPQPRQNSAAQFLSALFGGGN
jgi:hypothetical protein